MRAENMYRGGQGKNVKGKNQYILGMPKKKAHQPNLSESGPAIVIPKDKEKNSIVCYTDGSCKDNGKTINKGSYAFIVVENGKTLHEYSRAITNTTNNKCEMQAITDCILYIEENCTNVPMTIYSDSQYCIRGINEWASGWSKRGYTGIKNPKEWEQLYTLVKRNPQLKFCWVKGHSTNVYNQRCDQLCTEAYTPVQAKTLPDNWKPFISREEGAELRVGKGIQIESKPLSKEVQIIHAIEEGVKRGQLQGIAYMVAELSRYGGPDSNVVDAFRAWGASIDECIAAEASEYDTEILIKYRQELDK